MTGSTDQGSPGTWSGGRVSPVAHCVLAPNPGPLTLDGTNTWVVRAPDSAVAVVIDPGPDDEGHLRAVQDLVATWDARVGAVLLTHGHADHSAGARRFARWCGVGVRALDPAHRLGEEGLTEGDVVDVAGVRLDVLATPGHSADSLCFVLGEDAAVITGDTVLGRGTAVIHHPDGALGAYLDSLRRLDELVEELGVRLLLPGHGGVVQEPRRVVRWYLGHRAQRLAEVQAAIDGGLRTAREIVEVVYAEVDPVLWPAAELSVRAALVHLGLGVAPGGA